MSSANMKGWRDWFKALGDTARLMGLIVTRDPFIDDIERSAEVSRQRFEASMREVVKHEGGWRDHDWDRVSALAGLTPDGSIAPPPGLRISREPVAWRKAYSPGKFRSGYFTVGAGDAFEFEDVAARVHVEGINGSSC